MKKSLIVTIAIATVSFLMLSTNVHAASNTYYFNGIARAFGGKYDRFVAEDSINGYAIKYIKYDIQASDGNKLKISLLHTENWMSTAEVVASTDTLEAKNNHYVFYAIPETMSCPSDANFCLTMPNRYSTGNNIGIDITIGIRFINESWFFGDLNISGNYTIYH